MTKHQRWMRQQKRQAKDTAEFVALYQRLSYTQQLLIDAMIPILLLQAQAEQ